MMRSYLDESGLWLGAAPAEQSRDAIDDLVDAMESVLEHDDEVLLWSDVAYQQEVRDDVLLLDFLYPPEGPDDLLRDARLRLSRALDRGARWNDSEWEIGVADSMVVVDGEEAHAPSLAQAVAATSVAGRVCALALRTAAPGGEVSITLGDSTVEVSRVTTLAERPRFVRAWLVARPPSPASLGRYLARAFPSLLWADGAAEGLRTHSGYFFANLFETTIRHLAVLNDAAASLFASEVNNDGRRRLLAAQNVDASPESPNTRANTKARRQRLVQWRGADTYFWWHTKILYNEGRIHFHHDASMADADHPHGRIVVGLCVKHLDT
jgi:hypothetical protein